MGKKIDEAHKKYEEQLTASTHMNKSIGNAMRDKQNAMRNRRNGLMGSNWNIYGG